MSSRPLRFVQAGDFLLHQPPGGLMDVPDHLIGRLTEAPYRAAERVFDAALAEGVDFVLLSGNLCDPRRTGPRGPVFLAEQFSRLAERGIPVYWAAGDANGRSDWPAQLKWPAGVHRFAANRVELMIHHRDGAPLCQIAGHSIKGHSVEGHATGRVPLAPPVSSYEHLGDTQHTRPSPLAPHPSDLFAIAVVAGAVPCPVDQLRGIGNQYWACGGSRQPATAFAEFDPPCVVHCAGSPQGRLPQDVGPHGCTLVCVETGESAAEPIEPRDRIRLVPIATDVFRWHDERLHLPAALDPADFRRLPHERMESLIAAAPDRTLLIRWFVDGWQPIDGRADASALAAELLATLRSEYGIRDTPAWSVSLSIAPPESPASTRAQWSGQETLLGEFLRRIAQFESADAEQLESCLAADRPMAGLLTPFVPEGEIAGRLELLLGLADSASRTDVLRRSAALGADLLFPSIAGRSIAGRNAAGRADPSQAIGNNLR